MKKIIMMGVAASLLVAVTAVTGKAAGEVAAKGQDVVRLTSNPVLKANPMLKSNPALVADAYAAISESVLWSFGATSDDGVNSRAGLIADKWGNLYGTTTSGGSNDSAPYSS